MNILTRSDLKTENGLSHFEIPELANIVWLRHAYLARQGGGSLPPYDSLNLSGSTGDQEESIHQNKNRVAKVFGFDQRGLILLDQIHRDRILLLKKPILSLPSPLDYDALITDSPNTYLGILTADCLPIFAVDQKRRVIAAIHAGRQGTALRVTVKALKMMKEKFGCSPADLLLTLGPSIGPCCYEIDERAYLTEWNPFAISKGIKKWMIDLGRINIDQIKREGVKEEQISWIHLCTHCHNDLFFSYRKEGRTGRQLSFIGMV